MVSLSLSLSLSLDVLGDVPRENLFIDASLSSGPICLKLRVQSIFLPRRRPEGSFPVKETLRSFFTNFNKKQESFKGKIEQESFRKKNLSSP